MVFKKLVILCVELMSYLLQSPVSTPFPNENDLLSGECSGTFIYVLLNLLSLPFSVNLGMKLQRYKAKSAYFLWLAHHTIVLKALTGQFTFKLYRLYIACPTASWVLKL